MSWSRDQPAQVREGTSVAAARDGPADGAVGEPGAPLGAEQSRSALAQPTETRPEAAWPEAALEAAEAGSSWCGGGPVTNHLSPLCWLPSEEGPELSQSWAAAGSHPLEISLPSNPVWGLNLKNKKILPKVELCSR